MTRTFTETYDTRTPGEALTATNTAFDLYNMGAGSTCVADADAVTGVASKWTTAGAALTGRNNHGLTDRRFVRWYLRVDTATATEVLIHLVMRAGTTARGGIRMDPVNRLMNLRVGGTNQAENAGPWPAGEWVRAEYAYVAGVEQVLRLFWGANLHGDVPDSEVVSAAQVTGNTFDNWVLGSNGASNAVFRVDEVAADDTTWVGPTPTAVTGTGAATVTVTAAGAGAEPTAGFAAPTGLTATPITSTRVDLAWQAVANAAAYGVERDGVVIAEPTGLAYSDTGLNPSTTYAYRVRAVK